jgi:UDP-N-acetylglucosamine 4,6-dehydratase
MILERERWYQELLGRDVFRLPRAASRSFAATTILVTGGAGSIGSELVWRLCELDAARVVVFDNAEDRLYQLRRKLQVAEGNQVELVLGDINSRTEMLWVLEKHRPQVVFHAAAHKHVDFLEGQVLAAVRTNVFGTRNVLTGSLASGVESIIVLSSDKATKPVSVLGATKRVAELLVLANCEQANVSAVRLCNVLGTAGSLLPLVAEQAQKGVVQITDESADRYFIAPTEAADLLLSTASACENGVLIPAVASRLNIKALVDKVLQHSGNDEAQIKFEITGLRPGERLSEQLYSDEEVLKSSTADGLMKATTAERDIRDLRAGIEELEDAYSTGDDNLVFEKLMKVVPEYKSSVKVSTPVSQ